MVDSLSVVHLAAHSDAIPTLASWVLDEWGLLLPNVTFEQLVARFEAGAAQGRLPETFVALADGRLIGMASVVAQDMTTRPELSPWLAAVYVVPAARRQGVGSTLARHVMAALPGWGISRLYLFTPDQAAFYRRLGWETMERDVYRGHEVEIMVYEP